MSRKGLINDVVAPAWNALSGEARTRWHFHAQKHPNKNAEGELRTENGWQYFVDINLKLAVVEPALILTAPPEDDTLAPPVQVTVGLWKLPSKLSAGGSTKNPLAWISLVAPLPANTAIIITQGYDTFAGARNTLPVTQRVVLVFSNHNEWLQAGDPPTYVTLEPSFLNPLEPPKRSDKPRVRHVTVASPGASGDIDLQTPTGYFATTAGVNRFATITGRTARRRPDLPLGKLRVINTDNGAMHVRSIPNPTGRT